MLYYSFEKIYSTDKYTLVFEFSKPIFDIQDTIAYAYGQVHPKEVIEVLGDRAFEDWKNQIGIGPWMMKDYITASGGSVVRNPNYWGYDECFPDNQLPYMDGIKVLIIPDSSTAYAALRTGKIDTLPNVNWEIGEQLLSSNPHLQYMTALGSAYGLRPRVDVEPYDEMYVKEVWEDTEPIISSAEYEWRLTDKVKALNMYIVSQYWIVPGLQSFTYSFWQPWLMGYSGEIGSCALSWSRVWIDEDLKKNIVGQ